MPAPTTDTDKTVVTLRRIGNSVGLTIPKDVLERAGLEADSQMHLVETPDGLFLRRYDQDFDDTMAAYRIVAKQYENTLRELAK